MRKKQRQCDKALDESVPVRQMKKNKDGIKKREENSSCTYGGSLGTNKGSFFGISVMRTSVVSTRAAIEAAFSMALMVTWEERSGNYMS